MLAVDLLVTATRTGILNARYSRLASLSEELDRQVDQALDLIKRRTSLRDSLRLALTLLRFLIAALVLAILIPLDPAAVPIQTLGGMLLLIGLAIWLFEFFVERRILRNPETWALRLTPLARAIALVMRPILALPARLSNRGSEPKQLVTITEDELRSFVDASQREGVLEKDERRMIFSIFEFGDTLVREIMVPRIDIYALDVETPIDQAADALLESGYSRVPVYKGNIDNMVGLLYAKDLLKVWRAPQQIKSLRELLRPANFVPESKKLDDLLAEMQGGRIHIAIIVDEFGGVAGLVTMEDMMEEIVGEIQDEYDLGEELSYQKTENGDVIFHGRISLNDFNEVMGSGLHSEDADTLGGYLFGRIGRVPKVGEKLEEDGLILTIEQIVGRRIRRVRVQKTVGVKSSKERESHAQ
ncbi:MAG: hemolysin family protein [Chloroflexi bacterium]|nr:hemolysin family protein [Chloroflexota bacterium]